MGSHYIPVGKIKIDKDILDIVCPAAGYGETPPDPAIYCPAHGYTKDEDGKWEPPYEIPDPSDDSIVLVFENSGGIGFRGSITTDGIGTNNFIHVTIKDTAGNILDEFDGDDKYAGSYFEYDDFPFSESPFLVMIITPQSGRALTQIDTYGSVSIPKSAMKIVEARFNTPSILSLNHAFSSISTLKKVSFYAPMNQLTTFASFLSGSGIEYFKFPPYTFPSLTTLSYFISNTPLKTIDFNNAKFPVLNTMANALENCLDLKNFYNFNPGITKVSNIRNFAVNCLSLNDAIDLSTMTVDSSTINIGSAFKNTSITSLKLFKATGNITITSTYLVSTSSTLLKVDYSPLGDGEIEFTGNLVLQSLPNLREVIAPKILKTNYGNILNASSAIVTKLVLPEYFYGSGTLSSYASIKTLINTPICDENLHSVSMTSADLPAFEIPTMRISSITLGSTGGSLSSVVVDWANSFTHSYSSTTLLVNLRGQLSTAAIDAIFTALPTIPGGRIDVRYNPGYAACDKSIAQAKNWTVL